MIIRNVSWVALIYLFFISALIFVFLQLQFKLISVCSQCNISDFHLSFFDLIWFPLHFNWQKRLFSIFNFWQQHAYNPSEHIQQYFRFSSFKARSFNYPQCTRGPTIAHLAHTLIWVISTGLQSQSDESTCVQQKKNQSIPISWGLFHLLLSKYRFTATREKLSRSLLVCSKLQSGSYCCRS